MKVAYYFLSSHSDLGSGYGHQITKEVLHRILARPAINICTKVFTGDLRLSQLAMEREITTTGHTERFSQEKYVWIFEAWINPESPVWSRLRLEAREAAYGQPVFVMCFETLEHVTDRIFPPVEHSDTGRDLSGKKYRNRILAYADEAHRSDTNIDLVAVSTEIWASQVEKLSRLANKGVHAEVYRAETRRTLLRTILLLDDIVSLRTAPFEMSGHVDTSSIIEFLKRPR
jgi:hypothetical protein